MYIQPKQEQLQNTINKQSLYILTEASKLKFVSQNNRQTNRYDAKDEKENGVKYPFFLSL